MKELLALLPYLRKYRVHIAVGLVLVLVANSFSLAAPYLIGEGIDALGRPEVTRDVIARYALLIIGAALLGGAARYGMREILNGVSRRVEFDLRNRLFSHLLHLDASYYGTTRTGELMSRATNDVAAVRMVAGPAYMYLVNTVVVSLFALSLMMWIDPRLTAIAIIPLLALPPVTLGFGTLIHRRFEAIQEQFGSLSTMVQENLAGVRIVKAYAQEELQTDRFRRLAGEYLHRNLALARVSGLFHPLLGLLSGLALAGVLLLGGRAVAAGSITVGDFIAFMLYLGMLAWPMIALGWVVNLCQRGAASMRRINEIFAATPSVHDLPAPRPTPEIRGDIEFENVWFRYPGTKRDVLRDVSFRIPAGQVLALVGATGSGKSTLVNLIVRLYDPTAGRILIDGVPISDIPLEALRAAVGMVPQDTFLFSDTLARNLAIGFDDEGPVRTHERIRDATRIAQLDAMIDELPAAYGTLLGERGVNLSGGQKQRATLARALARDPRVLILDDALSAVDTHTEAEILRGLQAVLRERTSIIVSHRVSAVMNADLILVLGDGAIVERGRHDMLIARGGAYTALLRRQLLADEIGAAGSSGEGAAETVLAPPKGEV